MTNTFTRQRVVASIIIFMICLPLFGFSQQGGKISGQVKTSDDKPLAYATVKFQNTRYATRVDEDGYFVLQAPEGTYSLSITYANYTVHEERVRIVANEKTTLQTIVVQSKSNQLREVIVSDIQTNKFARKETDDIARMPLANMANPQAYTVVTKELFQELGAVNYNSALSQAAGTLVMTGINDSGNDIYLRGFSAWRINRNGLPIDTRIASEIFSLEKIEILKGPSATLFGSQSTSYGGVVNNVTKKPFESFRGEVSYTTGSWGMNRLTADVNTPLNNDRTALARFNVLGSTENGFQDAGKITSMGFATSLLFKANSKTNVRFDAEVLQSNKPVSAFLRNTQNFTKYKSMDEVPLPYDRAFYSDDITTGRSNVTINAEVEHKLSENWTSRTSYLFNQSGDKNSVFIVPVVLNDEQIRRSYVNFDSFTLTYSTLQQNFNGSYLLGKLKNQIVIGGELSYNTSKSLAQEPWNTTYDVIDINAEYWKPMTLAQVDKTRAEQSIGSALDITKFSTISGYFSNVTNISDRLFVMLSARLNSYSEKPSTSYNPGTAADPTESYSETEGYDQVNVSPKFGLVYQPIKDQVSIYTNYSNSFTNLPSALGYENMQDFNAGKNPEIIEFKPEQANQFEAGVKLELLNKRVNATVSYYDITVSNRQRDLGGYAYIQDGKFNSKGIEVDFIANPAKGWNIILGYLYNDSKYIEAEPELIGTRPEWTAEHTANFWTSYKVLDGSYKGMGVGAGLKYVDKVTLAGSTFYVPAYTVANATAFYDQPKYRIGLTLNNITNERYWDYGAKPQKPFEFLANLAFKF